MMRFIAALLLPLVCLEMAVGTACADYMLVKYRSGAVQTLRLDEPSSKIESISYKEDNASSAESPSSHPVGFGAVGTSGEAETTTAEKTVKPENNTKQKIRIKWAEPLDAH